MKLRNEIAELRSKSKTYEAAAHSLQVCHVFLARAEHDVLAAFIGDVAGKDLVQSVRLLQGTL